MTKKHEGAGIDRKLHDPVKDKLPPVFPLDLSRTKSISDLVRGMADYRQGEFAKAVDRLRLSLSPGAEVAYRDGIAYLFLAMAQQKLGRIEEARESMAKARVVAEEKFPKVDRGQLLGSSWSDWVRFQVIRREAEELVKPPAPVSQK